jgi:DNA-binding GntR family transcriptional regulator
MVMQLVPVETTTLQSRVYQALRDTLLDGQFRPGEVFTIRALAIEIGTSVMPVREALARLHAEGAFEIRPSGRQISVPVMSCQSVAELYKVRIELEGMAAAMAAKRITATELEEVEAFITTMKAAVAKGEQDQFLRANRAFHFAIYRSARSHHLMPIIESLWLKFGPLLRIPIGPGSRAETRVIHGGQRHHEAAFAALKAGKPAAACRAIRGDLTETGAWFAQHYDPQAYLALPRDADKRAVTYPAGGSGSRRPARASVRRARGSSPTVV